MVKSTHSSHIFSESYLGHLARELARDGARALATLADYRGCLIRQPDGAPSIHAVESEGAPEIGVFHEAHDEPDPAQGKATQLKRGL